MIQKEVIEDFYQFIKHHEPAFSKSLSGEWWFCHGRACVECDIGDSCTTGTINNETMKYLKTKHSEYFV